MNNVAGQFVILLVLSERKWLYVELSIFSLHYALLTLCFDICPDTSPKRAEFVNKKKECNRDVSVKPDNVSLSFLPDNCVNTLNSCVSVLSL